MKCLRQATYDGRVILAHGFEVHDPVGWKFSHLVISDNGIGGVYSEESPHSELGINESGLAQI